MTQLDTQAPGTGISSRLGGWSEGLSHDRVMQNWENRIARDRRIPGTHTLGPEYGGPVVRNFVPVIAKPEKKVRLLVDEDGVTIEEVAA